MPIRHTHRIRQDGVKTALLDFQPVPALDLLCTRLVSPELGANNESSERAMLKICSKVTRALLLVTIKY